MKIYATIVSCLLSIINVMSLNAQVSGTFTINNTQPTSGTNFHSFTEAAAYINCCINGPVVFNVAAGGAYNEQVTFGNIQGTSPTNTITINGNGASINFISTNTNERALIKLNSSDYVTIRDLVFNSAGSLASQYAYGVQLADDADHNTISNCTFNLNTSSTSKNFAGILIASSNTFGSGSNNYCDSNLVSGNTITGGYVGVGITGDLTYIVRGNKVIGNTIREMYQYGIYLTGSIDGVVAKNDVSRPTRSNVADFYGTYLSVSTRTIVSGNKYHNAFDGTISSVYTAYGVYVTNCMSSTGNENIITNNMIYSFNGGGSQFGLHNNNSTYARYYFNSVFLDGLKGASGYYHYGSGTGVEVKNNIIYISNASTGINCCINLRVQTSTLVSDYNDLHITTSNSNAVRYIGYQNDTEFTSLEDWKVSGKDAHSLSINPSFISMSDLHLRSNSRLDDKAVPITAILTDIDDEVRDLNSPAMGADEIPRVAGPDIRASLLAAPAPTNGCYGNETVIIRIKNNGLSAIDFGQNPLTVTANVTGAGNLTRTENISSGVLAAGDSKDVSFVGAFNMSNNGNYFFNAYTSLAGDVKIFNDSMPEAIRTRTTLSAGSISAFPSVICQPDGKPKLSAFAVYGTSGIQWQERSISNTVFTDISGAITNPYTLTTAITDTMYYRLVASCGTSRDTSSLAVVKFVNIQVTGTTPGSRCGSGTVVLGASANPSYNLKWYSSSGGGSPLGTGSTFITPSIDSTTTFYVEANMGEFLTVGPLNPASVGPVASAPDGNGTRWLSFNVTLPLTLHSVDVYEGYGNKTEGGCGLYPFFLQIMDANNVTIKSVTMQVATPINMLLQPGTYRIAAYSVCTQIKYNLSGASYPYVNGPLTITGASPVADAYNYFYNWKFTPICQSPRIPVIATVNPPLGSWLGNVSTAWENPDNWSCKILPDATSNVKIPNGATVVVSSNVTINKLIIDPSASFTVKSGFEFKVLH